MLIFGGTNEPPVVGFSPIFQVLELTPSAPTLQVLAHMILLILWI